MTQLSRRASLTGLAALTLLTFAPDCAPAFAESGKRAFDEVPVRAKSGARHPAYVAVNHLIRELGLAPAEARKDFSGKRTWTRYEFTVVLQGLLTDMQHIVALADQPYATPAPKVRLMRSPGGYVPKLPERRFEDPVCRKLHDPETFRAAVSWLQALTGEFHDELGALGADTESLDRQLEGYRSRAKTISERLLSGLAFSDVPQGHRAYDWLMELEAKILRFNLRETFWNRTYKGKRALTRYEFAYLTQQLAADVRWICEFDTERDNPKIAASERANTPAAPPGAASAGPPGVRLFRPGDAAFRNLADPAALDLCLQRLLSLYPEFQSEMKLLGVVDPEQETATLRRLQREKAKIARRLRRLSQTVAK